MAGGRQGAWLARDSLLVGVFLGACLAKQLAREDVLDGQLDLFQVVKLTCEAISVNCSNYLGGAGIWLQ